MPTLDAPPKEPNGRGRPKSHAKDAGGERYSDKHRLTKARAERDAATINEFWTARGVEAGARIELMPARRGCGSEWGVRSDLGSKLTSRPPQ